MYQAVVYLLDFSGIERPDIGWWRHREILPYLDLVDYSYKIINYLTRAFLIRIKADYYPDEVSDREASRLLSYAREVTQETEEKRG